MRNANRVGAISSFLALWFSYFYIPFIVLLLATPISLSAQTLNLATPTRGTPYPQMLKGHKEFLSVGPSSSERLDMLRKIVRNGPLGQRGLNRIFKDFRDSGAFDPTIPGIEKNIRLTASSNRNVRKGAVRNHLYAVKVHRHPEFTLLAVDKPLWGSNGKMVTDKDICFQHNKTGTLCRIESKDVSIASQRGNLPHYKKQIRQMASEYRKTGEVQAYINRHEIIPELKEYAKIEGVPTYENVITGERKLRPKEIHINDVFEDISNNCWAQNEFINMKGLATKKLTQPFLSESKLVKRFIPSWTRKSFATLRNLSTKSFAVIGKVWRKIAVVVNPVLVVADIGMVGYQTYSDIGRYRTGEIGAVYLSAKGSMRATQLALTYYTFFAPDPTLITKVCTGTAVVVLIVSDEVSDYVYVARWEQAKQLLELIDREERYNAARRQLLQGMK